ncbi:MAG: pyridoxamine 5'-phosphate oxidase family protein [Desulfarculaceae bacterium]|nr:pyridoxamine 5'-phosphate oxidase family protein [Desulfarculaceae bacterium]MCF8073975.1 pyridoxamine 5'-phosphate oxidase family protein [Desulfarculaceae bacterium]MCF8102661.1 pyridoxamine 5'-phosphate oxidase family protein [Desulfarculaceae bacterium]MCF8116098.1 pyridoxamine 5'-phosphate oxidase family protein [Desulfarculaceae bacterium]
MRRPPRKSDKHITDETLVHGILERGNLLSLAMCSDGQPYVIAMNYGLHQGRVYMHTGVKGLKMDILAANPRVSFTVYEEVEFIKNDQPCKWDTRYRSVVGLGEVRVVEDQAEKLAGLKAIARHCGHGDGEEMLPEKVRQVAVLAVEIDHLVGKTNG